MNIRYLEILEAVGQTGTFTGAAKKLHLTQSAVSHAIAELEALAGTALFDRLPRGVCLTPCGAALLEESQGILAACRNLDGRIGRLEEGTPVNVVSSITIASFLLPQILTCLNARMPGLKVNVRVVSAAWSLEALRRGEADIAFWEGAEPQGAFSTVLLGSYKLCAACAPSFPLEENAPLRASAVRPRLLSPQELCSYPLLLREQGSAIRDTFDGMLSLANQRAFPIWESVNSMALIKAAEAGLGITVLPDMLLTDPVEHKKLRLIGLDGAEMKNNMLAVMHKDKYITRPMQAVLDVIKETSAAAFHAIPGAEA